MGAQCALARVVSLRMTLCMRGSRVQEIGYLVVKGYEGTMSWEEVERVVCVDVTDSCSDSHYKDEL